MAKLIYAIMDVVERGIRSAEPIPQPIWAHAFLGVTFAVANRLEDDDRGEFAAMVKRNLELFALGEEQANQLLTSYYEMGPARGTA